jgi:nitrite reductase/ring-hydroxylating ferredoxin subunit
MNTEIALASDSENFVKRHQTRAEFLKTAALGVTSVSIISCLMACAKNEDANAVDGKNFSGSLTLTTDQKNTLDSQKFLNLDGLMVTLDGATYRAFGRRCPHESGEIVAQSGTSMQCQRHTEQFYNATGVGNGARTSASLVSYTVANNAGVLTITG